LNDSRSKNASVVLFCIVWSCASTRHPLQIKTLLCRAVVLRNPVRHFIEGCGNKKIFIFQRYSRFTKTWFWRSSPGGITEGRPLNDSRSKNASVVLLCSQSECKLAYICHKKKEEP